MSSEWDQDTMDVGGGIHFGGQLGYGGAWEGPLEVIGEHDEHNGI